MYREKGTVVWNEAETDVPFRGIARSFSENNFTSLGRSKTGSPQWVVPAGWLLGGRRP
jgi:hypothetical protein